MKIVKRGKKPKDVKRVTCPRCRTLFEYSPVDVRQDTDQRDNYASDRYVQCPVCHNRIMSG